MPVLSQSRRGKARVRLAMHAGSGQSQGVRFPVIPRHFPSLILCLLGLGGCALLAPNRAVVLSTNPPGASIFVNGKNSGFVTPCQLQLDIDEDARLDFTIPGFRPETRYVTPDDEVYAILWSEMYAGPQTWHFPLWLPLRDFVVPVKWTEAHAPGRIHIDLDRLSDERLAPLPTAGATAGAPR
jgi:hypothetical protein